MKKIKLDEFERNIEDAALKYKPMSSLKKQKVYGIIKKANEKKNISLRVNHQDLDLLKIRAEQEGIPYQTLLSSIIHKFVTEQLVDRRNIIKHMQLLKMAR